MTKNEMRNIPPSLRIGLRKLLRRYRFMIVLKGLSAALTVFILGMFIVMGLDRSFLMPPFLRWGLSVTVWLASAIALWHFLLRPIARVPDPASLAASVEAGHPELAEEFSSSVELITSPDRPEFRGSEELIAAVVSSADTDSRSVDFARVVRTERVRRFALVAILLLVVTASFWALWRADFSRTFARFVAPWASVARVSSTEILVLPGNDLVARSDSRLITASIVRGRASTCWLYVRTGAAPWTRVRMDQEEPGKFSHLLTNIDAEVQYHLLASDALTDDFTLSVTDRPAVASIDVAYDFPQYTAKPVRTDADVDGNLQAVTDSVATVLFHVNKPLSSGQIEVVKTVRRPGDLTGALSESRETLPLASSAPNAYSAKIKIDANGSYTIALRDTNGFANSDARPYRITAVPDAPPTVEITDPPKTLLLPRVQPVDLALHVQDDFGVAKVELVLELNSAQARRKELPVKGLNSPEITDTYTMNLASLGLRGGDTMRYYLEATDTHPGVPNVAKSQVQFLRIAYEDVAQEQKWREENLAKLKEQLSKLVDALKQAKEKEDALEKAAEDEARASNVNREQNIDARRALDIARTEANKLVKSLANDPVFNALKPTADEIAQTHVPNARAEMQKVDPNRKPADSKAPLDKAVTETNNALAKAEALDKQMTDLAKLQEEAAKLAELAGKEADLAKDAAKNDTPNADDAKALDDRQKEIENALDKEMTDADKAAALEEKAKELEQLANAVKDLAKREDDLKAETDDANAKRPDAQNPTPEDKAADKQKETKQDDIKGDTKALADKVAQTADDLKGLDPDMGKTADDAAKELKNGAAGKMEQASGELDKNKLPPASGREKEASDALKKTAGALDALKQQAEAEAAKLSKPDQQEGDPELADAKGQMQAGQEDLKGDDKSGKKAGKHMDDAANKLAKAANRKLQQGMPVQANQPPKKGNQATANIDPRQLLARLGLTVDQWNRLSSELRQELLEGYDEKYPTEYRKLIREYFREISGTSLNKE